MSADGIIKIIIIMSGLKTKQVAKLVERMVYMDKPKDWVKEQVKTPLHEITVVALFFIVATTTITMNSFGYI